MRALVLVDIQNDFMPFGALPVPGGDEVVPVANRLAASDHFDLVVATQDWHPPGHASFASSHPGMSAGQTVTIEGAEQYLWPDHCVQGTPGASFHSALNIGEIGHVIRKGADPSIDSYSTFFDNARLRHTGLDAYLRRHGVDSIALVGLATDYCVLYSALDARELGYAVVVVEDGVRAVNVEEGDGAAALGRMADVGCEIVSSETFVSP